MNKASVTVLAIVVSILTACGGTTPVVDNSPPPAEKPVTNGTARAAAKTLADNTVTQGKSLSNSSSSPGAAAGAAFSLGTAGVSLVNSVKEQSATTSLFAASAIRAQATTCENGTGYTVVGDTITYNCTYTYTYNGSSTTVTITGQIVANSNSVRFKTLKIDYDLSYNGQTGKYVIVYDGGFDFTATSINGRFDISLDVKANTAQGNVAASATFSTYYSNINFAGCTTGAKSGSITATSKGDGKYYKSGTVKVVFGPNCGDASVFSD
jgi:hypothetical protein